MKPNALKIKSPLEMQGIYRFKTFQAPPGMSSAEKLKAYREGNYPGKLLKVGPWIKNKIVMDTDYGLNLYIQHLSGDTTYPLELTFAGIGTGTAGVTLLDHDLDTPVLTGIERARATIEDVGELSTEWFIADGDLANGTYTEFGLYAGTQLYCRSLISPAYSKASGQDTLVEYYIIGTPT